jgi:hypothetical protein
MSVKILVLVVAFALPPQKEAESLLQKHILTVSGKPLSSSYASSFQVFIEDEKLIFKDCQNKKCLVKVQSKKMQHKSNLWKLKAEVTVVSRGKKTTIQQRQGCYFVENKKLVTYVEDCDGR